MKLWDKGQPIDELFENFTVGQDPVLDLELAYFDVVGSKAHVKMLGSIGLLQADEVELILFELEKIGKSALEGSFEIEEGIEDCHSQIELLLTRKLGDIGKKVHSGRSRNDQVLTALKLFAKDQLAGLANEIAQFFKLLQSKSEQYKDWLMPGYTHMQVAMPSSFGMWFGAYSESLIDDLILIRAAHQITNKSPLGSAAGYGSSFPLDREMSAREMGFSDVNVNSIYAQMTRGKFEKSIGFAISSLASTLSKLCMDVCTYGGQDFGFFRLDKKYTTGSSIMPHKQNPDGFELVRGKCNQLQALPYELNLILTNLPTGYHRDLQVLKERFLPGLTAIRECLIITTAMVETLEPSKDLIQNNKYNLLFTVEEVNKLVLEGVPFRDAYKRIGEQVLKGTFEADRQVNHTHLGSIGNLGTDKIRGSFESVYNYFNPSV